MKVFFIIRDDNNSYADVLGCYSSKEKAVASFPYHESRLDEDDIVEMDLDPPNGEAYAEYWSAYATSAGISFTDPKNRMRPSEFREKKPSLFWDRRNDRGGALAFGVTEEDAKANATDALKLLAPVWQVGRAYGSDVLIEVKHPSRDYVFKWEELEHKPFYAVHEDLNTARQILFDHESARQILFDHESATPL